jgi:hypothetical protein
MEAKGVSRVYGRPARWSPIDFSKILPNHAARQCRSGVDTRKTLGGLWAPPMPGRFGRSRAARVVAKEKCWRQLAPDGHLESWVSSPGNGIGIGAELDRSHDVLFAGFRRRKTSGGEHKEITSDQAV